MKEKNLIKETVNLDVLENKLHLLLRDFTIIMDGLNILMNDANYLSNEINAVKFKLHSQRLQNIKLILKN